MSGGYGLEVKLVFDRVVLSHFWLVFPFYTPLKNEKSKNFLFFSGGIKWEHWSEVIFLNLKFLLKFKGFHLGLRHIVWLRNGLYHVRKSYKYWCTI